jgi:hypothetical protein
VQKPTDLSQQIPLIRKVDVDIGQDLLEYSQQIKGVSGSDLRKRMVGLCRVVDEAYFEMAGMLHRVSNDAIYLEWGYKSFQEYIETELNFTKRKAFYFVSLWHFFAIELADEEIIRKIKPVGWSKAAKLVNVITKKNADYWIKKALVVTRDELETEIAFYKSRKHILPETPRSDAQEFIAPEKVYKSFPLTISEAEIVDKALEHAQSISHIDSQARNLALICMEYVSLNLGKRIEKNESKKEILLGLLLRLEDTFGINIIAIDKTTKDVLYGNELLDREDGVLDG